MQYGLIILDSVLLKCVSYCF